MYQLIQHVLIQQVLEALEANFVARRRNCVTGQVPADIRTLILHLFQTYGKITAKQLRKICNEVATMVYNLSEPITVIFDAIDNQGKLGELVGKPYTLSQIVDLAFLVISNYSFFRDDVRRWLRCSRTCRPNIPGPRCICFKNSMQSCAKQRHQSMN